jgi:hypothetical protein
MSKRFLSKYFFLIVLLLPFSMGANMRSPGEQGGNPKSGFAVTSKDIDIRHESIIITPNKDFTTAKFEIAYHIETDKAGVQIPLVFYASEFREDFKVWVDGNPIRIKFFNRHESYVNSSSNEPFTHNKYPGIGFWKPEELKYFEVNLTKGKHTIQVSYTADVTEYLRGWVKNYSVGYELWPAKYWKSFGTLTVSINNAKGTVLKTNLGEPTDGSLENNIATWKFKSLPADEILLYHEADVPRFAQILIAISPFGLMLIVAALLFIIHLAIIWFLRRASRRKYKWALITGSIVFPFIALISYMYFYDLIDSIIGENATRYHGYTFLIMFLYPVVMPVYLFILWLITDVIAKRIIKKQDQLYPANPVTKTKQSINPLK